MLINALSMFKSFVHFVVRYSACDDTALTGSDCQPTNWLRSRTYRITVSEANRICITVEFGITGRSYLIMEDITEMICLACS